MSVDILSQLSSMLPENFSRFASASLGESQQDTEQGIKAGSATLLASVMQDSTDPVRSRGLFETITSSAVDSSIMRQLPTMMGDRSMFQGLLSGGEGLLGSLLGNRAGSVGNALAQSTGLKSASAASLLSMLAPMLMGLLKNNVVQGGLDRGGLSSLLLSQKDKLQSLGLDRRLTSALGFADLPDMLGRLPGADKVVPHVTAPRAGMGTRGWLIAAAVAALAFVVIFSITRMLNKPRELSAEQTTADRLLTAATSVYFQPGQTSLDTRSQQALADIAKDARTSGNTVTVTTYANDSRDALATNRAAAVRTALLSSGVPESRIVVKSPVAIDTTGTDAPRVEVSSAP
jgi:flagellar motor protein MotB